MTFEVQQTRWDRLIRRVSGSIGPGSRVGETLGELFPTFDVELVPGELLLLGGTRLCWGGDSRPGVVAQTGKIQIFNPIDSGHLITVTRILLQASTDNLLRLAVEPAARLTNINSARYRDSRLDVAEVPVGQIRSETTATIVTIANRLFTSNAVQMDLRDENGLAVLSPGSGVTVQSDTPDKLINCTYFWREREALDSELNL